MGVALTLTPSSNFEIIFFYLQGVELAAFLRVTPLVILYIINIVLDVH